MGQEFHRDETNSYFNKKLETISADCYIDKIHIYKEKILVDKTYRIYILFLHFFQKSFGCNKKSSIFAAP